ncbi:EthD domain-containing protein [Nocardia sp. NPDC050175]|uniref:EthD domain-containing protein n=1 Tax=Nocardia sp. NPDC050175 TaxID=3364317 RepID=UPI0037AB5D6E
MFTMMTVIRKRPNVTTEEFRRFMRYEYGPTYVGLPETRSYVQYYLSDVMSDGAEPPIDAIVEISFDSEADMRRALQAESYQRAAALRAEYMCETSVGVHSAVLDEKVVLVGEGNAAHV